MRLRIFIPVEIQFTQGKLYKADKQSLSSFSLCISRKQTFSSVSIPVVQPTQTATGEPVTVIAKVQQPPRPSSASSQPTSYVVMDDQQPGTSRQMIYNPPSVAPSQQEESQHNSSGLSSLFAAIPSVLMYQQMDTPQPFSPSQLQPAPSPVPSSTHHEQSTSQPVQPAESESAQISGLALKSHTKPGPSQGHSNRPKTIKKVHVPKNIKSTPSNTYTSPQCTKKCE